MTNYGISHDDPGSELSKTEYTSAGVHINNGELGSPNALKSVDTEQRFIDRIGCRIYSDTAQTISDGTWTKVEFQHDSYDHRGESDLGNNRVTIDEGGTYLLSGSVRMTSAIADGTRLIVAVYKNGAEIFRKTIITGASTYISTGPVDVRELASGDDIDLRVYQDSGAGVDTAPSEESTYLTVSQLG